MLEGRMSIAAPYGSGTDYIQIEFTDRSSRTRFLLATISYKEFLAALVGRGARPCEFELATDYVGLLYKHEQRDVFVPNGEFAERRARAQTAVEKLESDGWIGRAEDALNHHRLVKRVDRGAWYAVQFSRYVEPKDL